MSVIAATASNERVMPNTQKTYEVRREDLPVSCPLPNMTVWNSHPKVYLPVEPTGRAKCPYCGADFILIH